jgi:trans-feruloyl-CoA hydratase/vanillin synthase
MADNAQTTTAAPWGENVLVEFEDGIAWVTLNRPDKRNAMSPALNEEMVRVLDALETDDRCGVLVLTGAGDSFSAGMDLKEYFRATENAPHVQRFRTYRTAGNWQWRMLMNYYKPTIAMVNGWCFGGAFMPLIACDIAIASEDAVFGVSEVNWGIIPGGNVTKALSMVISRRKALYYILTAETFDGRKAAELELVTEAVPAARLRERTAEVARTLLRKNPQTLRQAKSAFNNIEDMNMETAADYLTAKNDQLTLIDPDRGRAKGIKQFLDEKSFKPGLQEYKRG